MNQKVSIHDLANSPDDDDQAGLACPDCGCQHFDVLYTRPANKGRLRRRRACRNCGRRVTTYEKIA